MHGELQSYTAASILRLVAQRNVIYLPKHDAARISEIPFIFHKGEEFHISQGGRGVPEPPPPTSIWGGGWKNWEGDRLYVTT